MNSQSNTAIQQTRSDEAEDPGSSQAEPPPAVASSDSTPVIELADRTGRLSGSSKALAMQSWLIETLAQAATHINRPVERVGITVVGDDQMAQLHDEHMSDPTTTDVMTFPLSEPDEPVDVDVVICIDEARRQVRSRDHGLAEELLLYCLHGLLHCAGHEDHTPEGFSRMHLQEDAILQAIGVGALFASRVCNDQETPTPWT